MTKLEGMTKSPNRTIGLFLIIPRSSSVIFKARFRETRNLAAALAASANSQGEKIGATEFEPATCRRGDRSTKMH
jgi:hypothetical protein